MVNGFPPNSRYHGLAIREFEAPDGEIIVHLERRFVPSPERFSILLEHAVVQGDRLDNITARYIGDPEQYWRVCDANAAMRPDELTEDVGRRLRITLPEGIPGVDGAAQ
jgi:hypothetical protein